LSEEENEWKGGYLHYPGRIFCQPGAVTAGKMQ
jgi:hypothetical protein